MNESMKDRWPTGLTAADMRAYALGAVQFSSVKNGLLLQSSCDANKLMLNGVGRRGNEMKKKN